MTKSKNLKSLSNAKIDEIRFLLLAGHNVSTICKNTMTSYHLVRNVKLMMINEGLLKPLRTYKKRKMKTKMRKQASTVVKKEKPTLDKSFTRLIVNGTTVEINKAKEVVIKNDSVKVVY